MLCQQESSGDESSNNESKTSERRNRRQSAAAPREARETNTKKPRRSSSSTQNFPESQPVVEMNQERVQLPSLPPGLPPSAMQGNFPSGLLSGQSAFAQLGQHELLDGYNPSTLQQLQRQQLLQGGDPSGLGLGPTNPIGLYANQHYSLRQDQISPHVAQFLRLQALQRLQQQQQQQLLFQQQLASVPRPMQAHGQGIDPLVLAALRQSDDLSSYGRIYNGTGLGSGFPNEHIDHRQQQQNQLSLFAGHSSAQAAGPSVAVGSQGSVPTESGIPLRLPVVLARPEDSLKLSSHQVLLRHQIEAFQATEDDVDTHTRGRNKPIVLKQVGIRCRHCSHLPVAKRQKGSTYFPASLLGLYQAAQNMSTTHMQCGLCKEMPDSIKQQFSHLLSTKVSSSGAGRPFWAESAKKLGLVDTEEGIQFIRDLPLGVRILPDQPGK